MSRIKEKGVKLQITIPTDLFNKIEEDIKLNYTTKSMWFLRAAIHELERKEDTTRKIPVKKILDLDI